MASASAGSHRKLNTRRLSMRPKELESSTDTHSRPKQPGRANTGCSSGARLAALLRTGRSAAAELFADNVALDDSFDRRARRASELITAHGTLTLESVTSDTPMRGQATMRHADGTERRVDLELSPLIPARVQFYEVGAG